jgi:hypothetical protein
MFGLSPLWTLLRMTRDDEGLIGGFVFINNTVAAKCFGDMFGTGRLGGGELGNFGHVVMVIGRCRAEFKELVETAQHFIILYYHMIDQHLMRRFIIPQYFTRVLTSQRA